MKIKFSPQHHLDNPKMEFPYFWLGRDNWDDYSNQTLYSLYYYSSKDEGVKIGDIKIMHVEKSRTADILTESFEFLDEDYCSLGQDVQFYLNLKKLFPDIYQEILNSLNDAATNPSVAERYRNTRRFVSSLIRWSEAEKALREARFLLNEIPVEKPYEFTYSTQIGNASTPHAMKFSFEPLDMLPHRIIGITGRNGTGKTKFLSNLALSLSGEGDESEVPIGTFQPFRPSFTKVIAISYSAFDTFKKPESSRVFSYKFCGLKDDTGFLNNEKLTEIYSQSIKKIVSLNRQDYWFNSLVNIIHAETVNFFFTELFYKNNYSIFSQEGKSMLSSGQSILMYVVTEIIANIQPESLILFDEPEMHLHPNAIANLIRMLHSILESNDSYAILATHSPIIIQEIPSNYVYVFERYQNTPMISKLELESFGENLTTITENVFETIAVKEGYKEYFEKISKQKGYQDVLEMFDGKLSFNAAIFLKGLYNLRDSK